jgi:hypothetical protein
LPVPEILAFEGRNFSTTLAFSAAHCPFPAQFEDRESPPIQLIPEIWAAEKVVAGIPLSHGIIAELE